MPPRAREGGEGRPTGGEGQGQGGDPRPGAGATRGARGRGLRGGLDLPT